MIARSQLSWRPLGTIWARDVARHYNPIVNSPAANEVFDALIIQRGKAMRDANILYFGCLLSALFTVNISSDQNVDITLFGASLSNIPLAPEVAVFITALLFLYAWTRLVNIGMLSHIISLFARDGTDLIGEHQIAPKNASLLWTDVLAVGLKRRQINFWTISFISICFLLCVVFYIAFIGFVLYAIYSTYASISFSGFWDHAFYITMVIIATTPPALTIWFFMIPVPLRS